MYLMLNALTTRKYNFYKRKWGVHGQEGAIWLPSSVQSPHEVPGKVNAVSCISPAMFCFLESRFRVGSIDCSKGYDLAKHTVQERDWGV